MPNSSKRRKNASPTPTRAKDELREELSVRRLRAQLEKHSLRAALSAQKAMLATYAAADRGRRNKDWRAPSLSADMAIIPDAAVMNARARQMVRDTWIGRSAIAAFVRNVVGTGVIPIPQAKDAAGQLLVETNKLAMGLFWTWASDKQWCDVEQDQTHWQQQALAESERATVGEAFWVWSYEPHLTHDGKIDLKQPVGLKVQAFEPEQLDLTKLSYGDNEVRGGIEIDQRGVTVAYHVYTRNPNDFLSRTNLSSVRIPAQRVLHYFRKERVRQKRGETPLACVMQDMRDMTRAKDANLWRMIMEACIGATVKRDPNTPNLGGNLASLLPHAAGESGTTPGGTPTVDWFPGMIADPGPGVELQPYIPQAPGNQYEGFQRLGLRGVGAGLRISYGQISRDFTQGTYSGQRQEMLEDRKEFEPQQEMIAHNLVLPLYRIFFTFAVLEGRLDIADFESDPIRYTAADYVAPPQPWIDPKAESDALEKMIELRVITREEIAHMRGSRLSDILSKIAAERDEAAALKITFAENIVPPAAAAPADPAAGDQQQQQQGAKQKRQLKVLSQAASPPVEVPNYRAVAGDIPARCAACRFFVDGRCQAYDFAADPNYVCDSFEAPPALDDSISRGSRIVQTPPLTDGQRSIDDTRGDFLDRGERGVLSAK